MRKIWSYTVSKYVPTALMLPAPLLNNLQESQSNELV